MSEPIIEPIGEHQSDLGELLEEAETSARTRFGTRVSRAFMKKWNVMVAEGAGSVLLDGSDCVGLILYSTEYELGFSSFLSAPSARRLPRSATVSACHVLERARDGAAANERLLLRSTVSHLRSVKSVETIAVQVSSLYEVDLEETLARMGFMSCERARMERTLTNRIPSRSAPPGCRIDAPAIEDAEALRSVVYHGYFSEIDGYLFPDIAAVCSDNTLFREFLASSSIDRPASVMAKVNDYPCGCVLALNDEDRRLGLIGVVAVVPSMRRRGIARAMFLHVMRWLQENRHERAALAVTVENKPAVLLYSSLGFQEVGPRRSISVWRRSVSRPLMNFPR
jgi:GNAT superfamily N-acetyltransferase